MTNRELLIFLAGSFSRMWKSSLKDDLSGEPLDNAFVRLAKREEITEMYRRSVWTEAPDSACVRDTGKPPIPVRWVSTNKGDKLHPNLRCRLVAKHLAAKCGAKSCQKISLQRCLPLSSSKLSWRKQCREETGKQK